MSPTIPIVIVEDDANDAEFVQRALAQAGLSFSALVVRTEQEFLRALDEFKPEVILCDYNLPGFAGSAALELARTRRPEVPFVFVSGSIGEEIALETLKSGATDYILKDNMARLGPAVERALRESAERAEKRRMEEELIQSEKMAAVGLLIGGVAHELNNPLTAVMGHVELLLMENPGEGRLQEDLQVIRRETNRCVRLIKSLLAFARKHEHLLRDSDLNALAEEILELKAFDLRRTGISLVRDLGQGLPPALCDPHQIQQVLLNLLNNAEQAMEKTKGRITVSTGRSESRILLTVADTGPGIAPENLTQIFEPFFTTKEPGKGTGLGLSICAKLIKDHGGTLAVESKPGEGARFTVSLPASTAAAAPKTPRGRRRERVLLLDDDAQILQLMARALKRSGREVEAFAKPEEALAALRRSSFDIVVSDFQMPGMDGEKFYREAVALRPKLSERFILLTGQTHVEAAKPFVESARLPILLKPFDLGEFERVLQLAAAPRNKEDVSAVPGPLPYGQAPRAAQGGSK